jgi:hypothetical protein
MKEKCINDQDCVGVCMDVACIMSGNKDRLKAFIKPKALQAM